MSAELQLQTLDGQPVELPLRSTEITADEGEFAQGKPVVYRLANEGTTIFRDLAVWLDGPGADKLMLALDDNGQPGPWAEPGRSIVPTPTDLRPGEHARFWLCAVFAPEDIEDVYDFTLRITGKSIAQNTGAAL